MLNRMLLFNDILCTTHFNKVADCDRKISKKMYKCCLLFLRITISLLFSWPFGSSISMHARRLLTSKFPSRLCVVEAGALLLSMEVRYLLLDIFGRPLTSCKKKKTTGLSY